jgi:SET domain-containing protein
MLLVPTRLAQSRIHGIGVFALAPIAKGTPVWRFRQGSRHGVRPGDRRHAAGARADLLQPLRLSRPQHEADHPVLRRRALRQSSDTPNVATDYAQDPYGLDVALRDIAAGEELTMDYAGFEESAERGL